MSERTSKMWKQMAEHIDEPGHTSAPPAPGIVSPAQTWPCTKCGGLHKLFEGCFEPVTPAPAAPQCCMGYPRCIPGEAHNPECPAYTAPCPHCPELCGASCRCDCHNPVPDIRRLLQEAKKEVDQWPQWMKDAPAAPQQGPGDGVPERQAAPDTAEQWANQTYAILNLGGAAKLPNSTIALLAERFESYAASRVQVLEERLAGQQEALDLVRNHEDEEDSEGNIVIRFNHTEWAQIERAALTEDSNGN